MFAIVFFPIIALAVNAHVCAVDPANTQSVIAAMKPGVCVERQEVYVFNK